ncbi:alpha-(1-_3)-arabinofuranosyltransferase family protein [Aeromicrobium sp. NPDC092404]|uniref:alpha-(1->3)-arabinofuranosyltransferase domain-containing protein n=1 Tax=Aeromicrobium sp. NPDC092404 TaxID=3154976 RepID=UPI0034452362
MSVERVAYEPAAPTLTAVWRFRLIACCSALVAIAFAQAPGTVVTDTKLDLTADPFGFLGRSLSLWDPEGAFGQVQNQAYGYLFPMGPFFALGDLVNVSPWVTQRLWWSLLLVLAFLGTVVLLDAMRIGNRWTRILAGFAFALSPRMLTVLGASSVEMWPSAIAPWVLVPLVIGLVRGDPRRQAALSALAVALVGGVNAAATFAVVPLAAWWIWCAPRGARRRTMMTWWPPLVMVGTLWWLMPLLLLGRYSPPFLDYIEAASNTTVAATVLDALRGTTNWVAYVDPNADAGQLLITEPLLILNGGLVLVLGIIGLSRRDLPARGFLVAGLLTGLVLVTLGHVGSTSGLGSGTVRDLLDGPLAPLRNTHKFDVLLRLPLVIGLCHAVTRLTEGRVVDPEGRRRPDTLAIGVGVLACAAVLGATVPAWTGHVAPRGSYQSVPEYWEQTGEWIGRSAKGTTLVAPATSFGTYAWGRTGEEPLQAYATGPWAVRNVIPLAPGGNIEMLDTVSQAMATGQGTPGLAEFLRRAGIGTVVVRNDIDRGVGVVAPEQVRATLSSTPGMRRVATFGPTIGGGPIVLNPEGGRVFVDEGWRADRPAIEVFSFGDDWSDRRATRYSRLDALIGGPGSLLTLDELGVTTNASTVMAKDVEGEAPSGTILTDGNRRQEAAFGAVQRNRSASLTPQEPYRADRRVHRYDQEALRGWTTTPDLRGARSLTASSSLSDIGAAPRTDPSAQPWAAFDGDPETAWRPDGARSGDRSWLRLELDEATTVGTARITLDLADDETRQLIVSTETGGRAVTVRGRSPVSIAVGRVDRLEISARSTLLRPVAISEVELPGVALSRPLVMPGVPRGWAPPRAILMQGAQGRVSGCLDVGGAPRCSDTHAERVEDDRDLDRELTLPAAETYALQMRVAPRGGAAIDAALQRGRLTTVATSSQQTDSPAAGALAAVDGDLQTGWVAAADDGDPTVTVRWVAPRTVDTLRLESAPSLAASPASAAVLVFSDGSQQRVPVNQDGIALFRPVRATSVEVHLVPDVRRASLGFDGGITPLPVGVSEVRVGKVGGLPFRPSERVRTFPCGTGPSVDVDGTEVTTRLVTSPAALQRGEVSEVTACDSDTVALTAGTHRVTTRGTELVRPVDVLLSVPEDRPLIGDDVVVSTGHNANSGWTATTPSGDARPVVLDGWQQGWHTTTADADELIEAYGPGTLYRVLLGVGGLLLVALMAFCLRPGREARGWPAVGMPRAGRAGWSTGAAVAVAVLVAGWPGLLASISAVAAVTLLRRHRGVAAGLAAAAVAAAVVFAVAEPWAGLDSWSGSRALPQLLALAGVSAVAAVGLRRPRSFRRMQGSSTTR